MFCLRTRPHVSDGAFGAEAAQISPPGGRLRRPPRHAPPPPTEPLPTIYGQDACLLASVLRTASSFLFWVSEERHPEGFLRHSSRKKQQRTSTAPATQRGYSQPQHPTSSHWGSLSPCPPSSTSPSWWQDFSSSRSGSRALFPALWSTPQIHAADGLLPSGSQ